MLHQKFLMLIAVSLLFAPSMESWAQIRNGATARDRLAAQQPQTTRARQRPQSKPKSADEEIGPPEDISITTTDKVILKCTYYPGEKSKTTVPLILLHDWAGNRKDMAAMAEYLQQNHKFSVIVPDLRGHGGSTQVEGVTDPIDYSKFKKFEVAAMIYDVERCKKFLMEKNNLGQLNIEMLTIVAAGKTIVPAVQWSIDDWKWEPVGGRKQGKDVKAVMMISPERKLKGLSMTQGLKTTLFTGKDSKPLAVYMVWAANDETASREGNAIAKTLEKSRDKLDDPMLLVRTPYKTKLDATSLVRNPKHKIVFEHVAEFVTDKLVANKELLPWQNRAKQ